MTNSCGVRHGEGVVGDDRRTACLVGLFLLLIYLLLTSLRIGSGDGETIYQATRSFVEGRGFAIPPPSPDAVVLDPFGEPIPPEKLRGGGPYGAWGSDGRYYAQYGVGQSLLAVPFYLLGRGIHRLTGWGTEGFVTRAAVMLLNPVALAGAGGVLYCLARRLGYGGGAAVGVALVAGLATPLLVYGETFFSEPLVALALLVAVWAALAGSEGAASAWINCGAALGVAVLVKPVAAVAAPAFLVFAALRKEGRWRAVTLLASPLALALAGVGCYNVARFGSPFDTGYRTAAWGVPPWVGLAGLLWSPGKGLLWYCPPVLLGLAGFVPLMRRRPRAMILLGGVAGLYLLVHSVYNHWHGSGAWGPRLILPILPLLILPAAEWFQRSPHRAWGRLALALIVVLGFVVQVPAFLVQPARTLNVLYNRSASPTDYTLRMLYHPADSPLWNQWRSLLEVSVLMRDPALRAAVADAARAQAARNVDEGLVPWDVLTETAGLLSFNALNLWLVIWLLLGAPPGLLVVVWGALAILAGWAASRLWKELS
ncbi:MAG: glycosyltransferase family 39 protein [Anaerolineae bacterium]|nr:glycosyltransferase family 39 protein [Anaerolineae bacterium]